ncbi:MAG: SDR family NAD(P)-dependent oxidoreductase [Endomicrobium sp.]|jgi:nucleoside-diphosphate-sugar epimerase|nr:SDR family NAD(P)-dependent oxidoreductase [Endomicrobium sp.]
MSRILITGANGFIGSHIVETLIAMKNHHIICVVRKTSNLKWIKKLSVEYRYGDLVDKNFLNTIVENVDIIIHCAGIIRAVNKNEYFKINSKVTKNLCTAILKKNHNLKKMIFISSQASMGPTMMTSNIKKMYDTCNPISSYGLSKFIAESEIKETLYNKVPYTILRPAAVYGPRDKDIFILFNLIHKHLKPITITKRLLQLVYVKDVANSVAACLENKKTDNNVYYLANSEIYTWEDIGNVIASSVGIKTIPLPIPNFILKFVGLAYELFSYISKKPVILNSQKIDELLQKYWIADTDPAKNDLNVKFTSLEVASKITYNWYLLNGFFR